MLGQNYARLHVLAQGQLRPEQVLHLSLMSTENAALQLFATTRVVEDMRRLQTANEEASAALESELSAKARIDQLTKEVGRLEAEIAEISGQIIQPLYRDDFDTDADFNNARRAAILKIVDSTLALDDLQVLQVEQAFETLDELPVDIKAEFSALTARHGEEVRCLLGKRFEILWPTLSGKS